MLDIRNHISSDAMTIAEKMMLKKKIENTIHGLSLKYGAWNVFSEWVEVCAISIANAVDKSNFERREARYFDIYNKYGKENMTKFSEMFAWFTIYLEHIMETEGPKDVLGEIFHEMNLHNEANGQFFTPNNISRMTGSMVSNDNALRLGKLTSMDEPAVGAGAMVLGIVNAYHQQKAPWQTNLYVNATDIDERCVHMAYLQFSLFGLQAKVNHGNTITMEKWSEWVTPMAIVNKAWINTARKGTL